MIVTCCHVSPSCHVLSRVTCRPPRVTCLPPGGWSGYLCAQCEVSSLCQASFIQLITTMDSLVRSYKCSPSLTSMHIDVMSINLYKQQRILQASVPILGEEIKDHIETLFDVLTDSRSIFQKLWILMYINVKIGYSRIYGQAPPTAGGLGQVDNAVQITR